MRVMRMLWALALAAPVLAGCTIPHPPCDLAAMVYPDSARLHGSALRLGVIDASRNFPFDLPGPLSQTGATLAVLDDVRWGFVEPEAPQAGTHTYLWDDEPAILDTRVRSYQDAGFDLVIVLRAWNTWAASGGPAGRPGRLRRLHATPGRHSGRLCRLGAGRRRAL